MLKQMHSSSQGFTVYTNNNTTVGLHFPWQLNKVNLTDGVHHVQHISVISQHIFSMMRTMAWRSGLLGLLTKKKPFQYAQSDRNAIPNDKPTHEELSGLIT